MFWILYAKAVLLFFKYKNHSYFCFFLAGSYQLQVKSWALDQLKESESASSDKA